MLLRLNKNVLQKVQKKNFCVEVASREGRDPSAALEAQWYLLSALRTLHYYSFMGGTYIYCTVTIYNHN